MFDFKITDDGELEYSNGTGDMPKAVSDIKYRQLAVCRIKSVTNNWFNEDDLGANLEEYLGEFNNQETVEDIIDRIKSSLSDIIESENVFIIPKADKNELSLAVFIRGIASTTPTVINVKIDTVDGVVITDDINS